MQCALTHLLPHADVYPLVCFSAGIKHAAWFPIKRAWFPIKLLLHAALSIRPSLETLIERPKQASRVTQALPCSNASLGSPSARPRGGSAVPVRKLQRRHSRIITDGRAPLSWALRSKRCITCASHIIVALPWLSE